MDKSEYSRVVRAGDQKEVLLGLIEETGFKLTMKMVDAKILARAVTKFKAPHRDKSKFRFTPRFFTKLNLLPAVSIEVRESRSYIRKTCYGFRDRTGERVYLRIDPGSLVEFRDSPCGYLIGTRYLMPSMNMWKKPFRWDKIKRRLKYILSNGGIIVTPVMVRKYRESHMVRYKLGKRLIKLRIEHLKKGRHAETLKKVS